MRSKSAKRFVTFLVVLAMLLVDVVQLSGINRSLIAKADTDGSLYGAVLVSDVGTSPTLQNGNTSRKLAVGSDGTIYAVYRSNEGIRVAKSTDNGASFSPSVSVYNANYEAEVAVSSSGIVYVTWIENGMIKLARSTDHAATFSQPVDVGSSNGMGMGSSVHMTTDGNYLYFIDRSGQNFYKSEDGGDTFTHYDFNESYVFSDVHVDPFTHNVIVQKDNPSITYYISTDHGQTFSAPHMPGNQVFYSVGSIAATADTSYLLIAGQSSSGVKVNLSTGVSTTPDMGNNQVSQGRSLSDDWYGNVVTGFSDGSYVYYAVSSDLGETFGAPQQVAQTTVANASINSTNGDILFLYESNGQIYLKVFGGKLQGYDIKVSNSSLFFNAAANKINEKITITNISEQSVNIVDIKATGDFTVNRTGVGSTLSPGQTGEISVTYNPSENPTSAGKVSILYGTPTKERIISLNGALDGGEVVVGGPSQPAPTQDPAADLTATASKGTQVGDTKVNAAPADGNHLAVKYSNSTIATPNKGDAAPTGAEVTNPYVAGNDINLDNYNINRYLGVYELDSSEKVVGFKLINLQDSQIYGIPSSVDATAVKGTNSQETRVMVNTSDVTHHIAVKVSDNIIQTPVEGDNAPIGGGVYNPYESGLDINLWDYTLNRYLGVYELDQNEKILGFKLIKLSAAEVNTTAKLINAYAEKGSNTADTKINVTPSFGNHIAVKVSDSTLKTPYIGDPAPAGEGVTNAYVPGSDLYLGNYTQNKYVGVYELDGDDMVVGFRLLELTTSQINITAPVIIADPEKGSTTGQSKLITSPQPGNHTAIKVSSTAVPTPNIGDDAPTGVGVTNPYTSNTDIDLGDYTVNKYLAVYELDTNEKVVGFTLVNLTDDNINREAKTIVATVGQGTNNGSTKVNVVPGIGDHIAVKVSNVPLGTPNTGDYMETGLGITNPYTPGTDINLGDYVNNKYLGVYELDSNQKIVGFKLITLTNEDVNKVSPEIVASPEKGDVLGRTKVNATAGIGNHLAVMVSEIAVPTPNKGDDMPLGLGITNPYVPGTDINLGDYTKNRYVAVYELDSDNKVVGFKLIALSNEDINITAPEVTVDAEKGTGTGKTQVTATAGTGNHLAVKVSDKALPSVNIGDAAPIGEGVTNPYTSGTDVNLGDYTKNKYIGVYELDKNDKVVGFKTIILDDEQINRTAPEVTVDPEKGTNTGETKITATAGTGNHLVLKVSDSEIPAVNIGDAEPTGTGVTNPYVSGTDINIGDYTKNKYLAVYEVDSNGKVVGFKSLTLTNEDINRTAPEVSLDPEQGTTLGNTKVTATAGNGNHLAVKVSDAQLPAVNIGDAAPTGTGVTNPYTSGADINLGDYTKNKYLAVYELDSNDKVVGFKQVTLTNEEINRTAPEVTVAPEKGTTGGKTQVTATVGEGNHLVVKVSDTTLPVVNVGDDAPTGTGVINPYVSGTDIDLGDYAKNKYLGVYEVDKDGKIVGFKSVTLTNEDINTTAPEVTATVEKGTALGETKINATAGTGNHLVVKVSDTELPVANKGEAAPTGTGVTNPYVSGTDIILGDYTKNKYLGVYEVDKDGNIVSYKTLTLQNEDINRTAPEVTADPEAGANLGNTKVTVAAGNGNQIVVKVSDTAATNVNVGDAVPTGTGVTNPYVSGTDINLGDYAKNKYLEVYEVDSNNKVVGFKLITLTSEDINRTSSDIAAAAEKGSILGKTKILAEPAIGNHLAVMVSDVVVAIPNKGDAMPQGLGITNPYVSGSDINLGDYTKNKYVSVYELDTDNKVVGFRLVALSNEDINRTAPEVTVAPEKGSTLGETKVTATVAQGNHLVVKVSDTTLPIANVGDAAPTGTGVTNPYVSGTDIKLGDYTKNKYLGVYEVDGNGKVVGFKQVTLTNEEINRTAPEVTVDPQKGTTGGKTQVTATVGEGNHLVVKVSDTALPVVNVGDAVPTGTGVTNPYVSGTDINLGDYAKNKYLGVYEVDKDGKIVGFKSVVLTNEDINTTAPEVTATVEKGTALGETKINATAGNGNHIVVKVSETELPVANKGEAAPTGTGVTNPYVSGTDINLGDYTKNKYLGVYEVDKDGNIVSYKTLTLQNEDINRTAPQVTADADSGTKVGNTKVTVAAGNGNHIVVKVSDTVATNVNVGDAVPTGTGVTNPYVSGTDINLGDYAKNKYLEVYEVDSNNKVVGFKQITLTNEDINRTSSDIAAAADKGTTLGKTKIIAEPAIGNHLAVMVSDVVVAIPNKGDAMPQGLGITNPYVSGSDINLGDYTKNKYVSVYELDADNKVVGFRLVALSNEEINRTAPEVTVAPEKGSTLGETKVTATVAQGNHLVVKVSDTTLPTSNVGDAAPTGTGVTNPYVSGTDIKLGDYTKNKYLGVYEVDGNGKVVGFKQVTLTNEEINRTAPEVTVAPEKGTTLGETKVTATVAQGNHLAVKVSDTLPQGTLNVGDTVQTGTGLTNPYVSGTSISLGDYSKNKYLTVYELDANNKVVGYKVITLTNEQINRTAPEVTTTTGKGTTTGNTKINATVAQGNHLVVKVSDATLPTSNVGDAAPTGTGVTNPYVSGTDINLGDYTKNKYLGVYEVDANGKVVGFKQVTLTNEDINTASYDLAAAAAKGSTLGKTKVLANAAIGNHLAVIVSDTVVKVPSKGDVLPSALVKINPYTSGSDISLGDYAKNKYLGVYELDSNNKVIGFKAVTLTNEEINRTAPEVTTTVAKGTNLGKTKVTASVGYGNRLVVKVSDTVLPTVNVGDAAPTGTGVTNPYVSGTDINLGDYSKNKYLGVYEVDMNGKVVGFKSVTLTNDQVNRTAPEVTSTVDKGTNTGKTKITATVSNGNHLAVRVSDALPEGTLNVGDAVQTTTGLTNPYASGSDISLGDYAKNKYLTVYELDANNKVVGYKVITLTNEQINRTAPEVTLTSAVGTATGTTKITGTAGSGNHLAVKVLDGAVTTPNVGDTAPTGTLVTNPYTSGSDIALGDYTKNKYLGVYELDGSNKVVSFKFVTLADNVINKTVVLNDTQSVSSDKDSLQVKYADGDSATSVTKPLILSGNGSNGTTITWSSNPSGLVSKDGTLARPLFDTDVKLTATIAKGKISDSKDFSIKLKGTVPVLYDLNSGSELIEPTAKEKESLTKANEVNIGGNRDYLVDLFIMSIEKKNTNYEGKAVKIGIEEKPVVDTKFFSAIDGKDISLSFVGNKVGWTFNGKDITADKFAGMDKIDLSLKEPSAELISTIGNKLKSEAGKEVEYATFSYTYDGYLPGKATAKVYVGKQWANKTVDVGRFYTDKNNYDIVAKTVQVDSEGYVSYMTNHCSDYFVVESNALANPTTTTNTDNLPKTGSPINTGSVALAGFMLVALGYVVIRRNKRTNM